MPDTDLNQFGLATALRLYYGSNLPRLIQPKQHWDHRNHLPSRAIDSNQLVRGKAGNIVESRGADW